MAQQPQGRFRRFVQTPLGQVALILIAVAVVVVTYVFVDVIIAVPAILLFGLAFPIWMGLKRPRFLALVGLVIIVAVAPLATVVFTQEVYVPVSAASSATNVPLSDGKQVMQNATVSPYTGGAGTNFTWTVTIYPQDVPENNSTPVWLNLYISTCPGATGNDSPNCQAGYPFTLLNQTLPNTTQPYTATFHYRIGSNGIWSWQMGIFTKNRTTGVPYFQTLQGDPTYNGIQGPIIGGFAAIYGELITSIYIQDLLLLGAPFYFALLVYMLFKNRERRHKEAQQRALRPGPAPTAPAGTPSAPATGPGTPLPSSQAPLSTPTGPPAAPAPSTVPELNCPKCNAVVYAGEKTCWKCGAALPTS